jgi:glutaredoxin 3
MKRYAPALAALLLACAPPSDDAAAPAAPARQAPASPKLGPPRPTQEKAPAKRSKSTLQAGRGYYQYVDESGHVRFAASLDEVPERQRSTAGHISLDTPPRPAPSARARREGPAENVRTTQAEVVLYTTTSCPYCKRAIVYLDGIGQDYVNKNVEHDSEARDEYLNLTGGRAGVPVIVVGDRWMQGWSKSRLDELLAASR